MVRHLLVVLDPDAGSRVLALPGEPDGHADLERRAGTALWPAGPDLADGDAVLHRCLADRPVDPAVGPVPVVDDVLAALVARAEDEEAGRRPVPADRAPWFRRGWDAEALAWVDMALADVGRPRTGPGEVVRAWSLALLLRVPTAGGPVWLKGCAPHFPAEPGVTRWLAEHHPGAVPGVVAAHPDRGLLLMEPFPDAEAGPADLPAVGARIADLQLSSLPHRAELAAAGVPARGVDTTAARFAEVAEQAMGEGVAGPRLGAAVPEVLRRCSQLTELGLPDTLCHGDLHLGNVARSPAGPVLFDWSDACWSQPFLDVVHLPQVGSGAQAGAGWERGYRDRWLAEGWSADVLQAALGAAVLVERAFQAVTYADLRAALEPGSTRALDGVLARILRQVVDLVDRGR